MRARLSLSRRLLLAAGLALVVALVVAGLFINNILSHFVRQQIDGRLDAQLLALAAAVELDANEAPILKRDLDLPPYDRALSGWYWQVETPGGTKTSRSLGGASLDQPTGPAGEALHRRRRDIILPDEAGTANLLVAAPQAEIDRPLRAMRIALALSLVALGLILGVAIWLQVFLGLRPLRRLAAQMRGVRSGMIAALPNDQPAEVSELVGEVNALLTQNRERLQRARAHVANLAHGLKTPLAALAARADDSAPATVDDRHLIDLMNRRIAHHLRRARTAAVHGEHVQPVLLAPKIADLLEALRRIHADRQIAAAVDVADDLAVRCDPQDVDEMLGNLLDNAFKWARASIAITAGRLNANCVVSIRDDGHGLQQRDIARALERGERLDEVVAGSGFGLPITSEIAALYGGTLRLEPAPGGGLTAVLTLPG